MLAVPRNVLKYRNPKRKGVQLHLFADASETGYGSVVYVRFQDELNKHIVHLLTAKARVAPLKTVSIPRLEFNAAVMSVRLYRHIKQEFDHEFEKVVFWTDSMIVIRYIDNTSSRFSTYVANRVQEILESSEPNRWKHVN